MENNIEPKLIEYYRFDLEIIAEFSQSYLQKDYKRVHDIIKKANGNVAKEITLARVQAQKIRTSTKARARCVVAFQEQHYKLCEQFYMKWLMLEYPRKYKLKSFLDDIDSELL